MKPNNTYRKRLLESIIWFSQKLRSPSKTNIYKVLAELDFQHFNKTGMPVTNLEYEAWEFGPVPASLHREISVKGEKDKLKIPEDFMEGINWDKEEYIRKDGTPGVTLSFIPKRKPDMSVFTQRQVELLEQIADVYKDTKPSDASQASHQYNKPWKRVYKKGENNPIDYTDSLDEKSPVTKEEARERMIEIVTFTNNFRKPIN